MIRLLLLFALGSIPYAIVAQNNLPEGLSRKLSYGQMVVPYAVQVTFNKTVHILFPAAIRYVDLGSSDIIAGKADGAENVLRIKAAIENFSGDQLLSNYRGRAFLFVQCIIQPGAGNPERRNAGLHPATGSNE